MADVSSARRGLTQFGTPSAAPTFNNHTVDANNDGVGWVFQAPDAVAITHIGYRYGARTGTPPTFVATIESPVVTTGLPDGADVGGGSPTAKTFTPPADATIDGLWQWVQLTNAFTPTKGAFYAPTIRYSSGTIDGSNFSTFTTDLNGWGPSGANSSPYAVRLTGGTWAKRTVMPVFGVRTASTRYGNVAESGYNTRSASTVGHRRALKFTVPSGSGTTFTVKGLRFTGSIAAASGKAPIMGLWSAGGVIQNVTLDSDIAGAPTTAWDGNEFYFDEASLTALSPGTVYYAGLEVADAASGGVLLNGIGLNASGDLAALSNGANWHHATFDGSNWSDDQTVRPFLELILDDMTCSGGSGGMLIHPGMVGGLRG